MMPEVELAIANNVNNESRCRITSPRLRASSVLKHKQWCRVRVDSRQNVHAALIRERR